MKQFLPVFPFIAVFALLTACSAQIAGVVREDGSADITIQSGLLPSMTAIIHSLFKTDGGASQNIIDAKSINASIGASKGVKTAHFRNITSSSIEGTISLFRVNDFLSVAGQRNQFLTFDPQNGRLLVVIDRISAPRIVSLLSPDLVDYLSCLMSPAALEDYQYIQTKAEYLDELQNFFGNFKDKKLAANLVSNIKEANIHITVNFPKDVKSVQGGRFSGKRAEFDVPLLDLLAMETPLTYDVRW
ncbi:MAG: hypothetical protein LBG05_05255 [Treponema sp.]|jgi:hypothetical protein|nr:hypothetical protein [Treponema sp.]